MITVALNTLNKGMTGDPRDRSGSFRVMKHFNSESNDRKLTPHRDLETSNSPESALASFQITKIIAANGTLFGYGNDLSGHPAIYMLSSAGVPTSNWIIVPGTPWGAGGIIDNFFVYYQNYIYVGYSGGIIKYGDITSIGSAAFANETATYVPSAQGLVHSKDDIMYIPVGSAIYKKNGASGIALGIQLPTNSAINSICEYNNYLAIACDQPDGSTVVYLWDRDSSLTTLSEKIDWGIGSLKIIESIGGTLLGISTTSSTGNSLSPEVQFKYWNGSSVITFKRMPASFITLKPDKQKFNDLFYFLAEITIHGVALKGVWKIHKLPTGELTVSFDTLPRNDTALDAGSLKSFYRWGDYMYVSYLIPSTGAYTVWRTDDSANYTATSVFETTINQDMPELDRTKNKQLMAVSISFELLPVGAQATLKYRVDGGAWTTILTEATEGAVTSEQVKDATGTEFTSGREYEFHVESLGGAEITEVKYKYEIIPTLI
jgi:hypothetical protein